MQKINVKKVRAAASKVTAHLAKLESLLETPDRRKLEKFTSVITPLNAKFEDELNDLIWTLTC